MSTVDWSRYRSCPVCFAALGEPCMVITGYVVDALGKSVTVLAVAPHSTRQGLAGGAE